MVVSNKEYKNEWVAVKEQEDWGLEGDEGNVV